MTMEIFRSLSCTSHLNADLFCLVKRISNFEQNEKTTKQNPKTECNVGISKYLHLLVVAFISHQTLLCIVLISPTSETFSGFTRSMTALKKN